MQKKGYVSFVLHAHLPFIHHPESDDYLEESWLYEAISETYIPLLHNFQKLVDEGVKFRITMSMTPPLLSMLDNKLLQKKYIHYLEQLIELSEKEIKRTEGNERVNRLSHYYYDRYTSDLHFFKDECDCNLIEKFKYFQDIGVLEIITCGATHGYFPILYVTEETVRAQIAVGVQTYEKYFGRKPRGIWLPECGYVPEADKYLREFGIEYAIVESHGILYADPTPIYGTCAPITSPGGLTCFGRDITSSQQVWSSIDGYPGDFNYREFYRDIGYEADYDYIKPYIAHNGVRVHTGIRYYRITGKTEQKDIYDIQWAKDSAERQAGHFLNSRTEQIENSSKYMNVPPIIVCTPCRSSWGANGYSGVWLNPTNDYAHRHLHKAGNRMVELATSYPNATGIQKAALNQAARELLLAQSSDWLFIITNGTMVDYAKKRINDHIGRFTKLYNQIKNNKIDKIFLKDIEKKDCVFPDIDYHIYTKLN